MKYDNWYNRVIVVFGLVCLFVTLRDTRLKKHFIIKYDKAGYYHYLPAIFIYKDIKEFKHLDSITKKYHPPGGNTRYGLKPLKEDNWIIKYTSGVAISELPFFIIADLIAKNTNWERDGFSRPYQVAIVFANLFYILLGLILLAKYLHHYFSEKIVALVIASIGYGTNLFFYSTFDVGMSHGLLFSLLAAVLYCSQLVISRRRPIYIRLIFFFLGFAVMVRPTSLLFIIPVIMYPRMYQRLKSVFQRGILEYVRLGLLFVLPTMVQMIYWWYVTGSPIYYSYQKEGFDLFEPHIFLGLFSFKKGWFIYTPLAIIASIGVLRMLFNPKWKSYAWMLVAFYLPFIYIVFSWSNWWYGGSFGSRVMVDTLALLAIPLAVIFKETFMDNTQLRKRWALALLLVFIVSLNLFQTYQYRHGIMHWDKMTQKSYFHIFGKTKLTTEEYKDLYPK